MWKYGVGAALLGGLGHFGMNSYLNWNVDVTVDPNDHQVSVHNVSWFPIRVNSAWYAAYGIPLCEGERIDGQNWLAPGQTTQTHVYNEYRYRSFIMSHGISFRIPYWPFSFTIWRDID